MKIVPLFLLIGGITLLVLCLVLLVQIVTYKLRIRKVACLSIYALLF